MKRRKARNIRLPASVGTRSIERSYTRLLNSYQKDYSDFTREEIMKIIPNLKDRNDLSSASKDIDKAKDKALKRLDKKYPKKKLEKWVQMIIARVSKDTSRHLSKGLRQVEEFDAVIRLDEINKNVKKFVDFFSIERELDLFYHGVITENVDLIKSISLAGQDDLRDELMEDILKNKPIRDIEKTLMERLNVSKSKANLIARDQVGKLNSSVTEAKQVDLGIKEYIWRTSNDGRVRNAHSKLNGKKFKWSNAPISGPQGERLHPGQNIQCRCYAEPVLEGII